MDPYERMQLCDGLKDIKFNAGEYIIREVLTMQTKRQLAGF